MTAASSTVPEGVSGLVAPRPGFGAAAALLACAALAGCDGAEGPAAPPTEPPDGRVPASVEIVAGDGQRAVQGLALREEVVVRVLDDQGGPVSGAAVAFAPAGGGSADPASVDTDADGMAAAEWTLGPDPGPQTLNASAGTASAAAVAHAVDLEAELDSMFAAATEAEVEMVREEWAGRDVSAADVRVELSEEIDLSGSAARLRVVSHLVDGGRHYGAIVVPDGAADGSLPILAYLHGGDDGVSTDDFHLAALALGEFRDSFVYVVPSFRSEPLRHGSRAWVSEGGSSHWDRDVDDAIALVNAAIEIAPAARPDSIHVMGGSRGAGVALLAGARDERIARIVAFFGPTDFFDDWVRGIVREAALRMPRDLPGVAHLDSTVVQPYVEGRLPRAAARMALVRRSAVLFAADLPSVQLHHGAVDEVVSVSQAEILIAAMKALGRGPPDFEAYIYQGGGHALLGLNMALQRAVAYLARAFGSGR